jgi:glycerophosphoryl diester phosphodiesterase
MKLVFTGVLAFLGSQVAGFGQTSLDTQRAATNWIQSTRPAIVAHRGCWEFAPENSLKGLKACQSLGVEMVEGDIHKTKDGVLVIMHDDTLDRMTNLSGPVKNYTYRELTKARLREAAGGKNAPITNEPIPSFVEWLRAAKSRTFLLLDVKEDNYDEIYDAVAKEDMEREVVFLVYLSSDSLRARRLRFLGKSAFMPVIWECSMVKRNTDCYTDADFAQGRFLTDYQPLSPVAYLPASDGDSFLKIGSTAAWRQDVRLMGSTNDEDSPKGGDAIWGPLLKIRLPLILTNRADALMGYLEKHQRR